MHRVIAARPAKKDWGWNASFRVVRKHARSAAAAAPGIVTVD
jgi:hypothetical protein